jgi:diphthamide synthase (EF-2-diphthine--ammonia ligase)
MVLKGMTKTKVPNCRRRYRVDRLERYGEFETTTVDTFVFCDEAKDEEIDEGEKKASIYLLLLLLLSD